MSSMQGVGEHDIGYATTYTFNNYGTALTFWSMYRILQDLGLSVLMIERPMSAKMKPNDAPRLYRHCPYAEEDMAPLMPHLKAMSALNDRCKMFLLGSDQLFNNYLYNAFGRFITLTWVRNNKRKIGYAISFGFDFIFGSEFDRAEMQRCLKKLDAVSVREASGVGLLKREFGVDGTFVLDPVFLNKREYFEAMAQSAVYDPGDSSYYFAYIIDPTPAKQALLEQISQDTGIRILAVSDAERTIKDTMSRWQFPTLDSREILAEDWLRMVRGSVGIITDSFHGTCFAMIFEKPFVSLANSIRGVTRFESILSCTGLKDRMLFEERFADGATELNRPVDYLKVNGKLDAMKAESRLWLERNLLGSYPKKGFDDYDALNIRMDGMEDDIIGRTIALQHEQLDLQRRIAKIQKKLGGKRK